ncbi:MAG TPA: type II secretion system F family protein [Solirubrobacteraceae bacterium]|nr:type II secretion system F family protein [Solirubrobacteraceae bacterium]
MTFLFVLGVLLLASAAALTARAIALARVRVDSQVRQIGAYGFNAGGEAQPDAASGSHLAEAVSALAERIGAGLMGGAGWRAPVTTQQLRAAGLYKVTPVVFQGYRFMGTVSFCGLLLLFSIAGGSVSALTVLLLLIAAALAWLAPAILVGTRAQRRMDHIDRDLPELIDLLIATIEAGLGFAGSLQLVADRFEGPLGQELRLTLREQNMGLSTERALNNLLERCETPSVRAFVRAVSQGEALGVSVGTMMRNLAAETRKRRRQSASEQVQKAPVKMLFPLVFLVFPSLLIVLLYPALYQVIQELGAR